MEEIKVGERIEAIRRERGLTYKQMSELCHVPESTIKNIASGKSVNTGVVTLQKICQGFGIQIIELFD